tara:strand:- start:1420 stop:2700 length:1281 start_codon:yes stop_codon:yes gene_type:complete
MNQSPLSFDLHHIWHPYSSLTQPVPPLHVDSAHGVELQLKDGTKLIDGMASWWSAIHGYNHPVLNKAAKNQIDNMSHVMFGGLTHDPAISLCQKLVNMTPATLTKVFLSDSGSVAVDVAIKMAIQYWYSLGHKKKTELVALRGGYHGDTLGSMSACDPDTGMHHLFKGILAQQHFVNRPQAKFGQAKSLTDIDEMRALLTSNHETIAAVILEPIVQGAGGMYFYSADYLANIRQLCDQYNVLLIADEIATGFGRTGELFACHHASIAPDIMCLGKALTGGYLSLAATLTTDTIAETICQGEGGAFMHGPTFMGNPLACSIANASVGLLLESDWQTNIKRIENQLNKNLLSLKGRAKIADARVLGGIGVIEAKNNIDMHKVQKLLPDLGVWLRPFGKLVYTMPPYIMKNQELDQVCHAIDSVIEKCS